MNESVKKRVKCVIWDLDETLWRGVLLEGAPLDWREDHIAIAQELNRRGILQSIASRNVGGPAMERIKRRGLVELFLCPQLHMGAKSASVAAISERLDIPLDAIVFIDDQPFEREEVRFHHPAVRCLDPAQGLGEILDWSEFSPGAQTEESRGRPQRYQEALRYQTEAESFLGSRRDFLSTLQMECEVFKASVEDLDRASELTQRTHQLNTTGLTFDAASLGELSQSADHALVMARLRDRYGEHGRVGLSLIEQRGAKLWALRLLLMSCRVISRDIGGLLLIHCVRAAKREGVTLQADFLRNDRNRLMLMTYRFSGFQIIQKEGARLLLEMDPNRALEYPAHAEIHDRTPRPLFS